MIEINNLSSVSVDKKYFKKVSEKVFQKEKKERDLSIAIVGSRQIKKLNKIYRKKNKITDVLSFSYNHLGEIIICTAQVEKNAKKYHSTFKKELTRVLIHGILHILGYEHELNLKKKKLMEKKENQYYTLCQKLI